MNKIVIKKKLNKLIMKDLYENELEVCKNLKYEIMNILKSYFIVDNDKTNIVLRMRDNNEYELVMKFFVKDFY